MFTHKEIIKHKVEGFHGHVAIYLFIWMALPLRYSAIISQQAVRHYGLIALESTQQRQETISFCNIAPR